MAYEERPAGDAQGFVEKLQTLLAENLPNAKTNIQEVGYRSYCRGFAEGYDSVFFETMLKSKVLITNCCSDNHLVPGKSFLAALRRNFNLVLTLRLYQVTPESPQVQTIESLAEDNYVWWQDHKILLQPREYTEEFTTPGSIWTANISYWPELQRLGEILAQPGICREVGELPEIHQWVGDILLGETYAVFVVDEANALWTTDRYWQSLLWQRDQLMVWQENLRVATVLGVENGIKQVKLYVYGQDDVETMVDAMTESEELLSSTIKLVNICQYGQVIFPYDNSYYRQYVAKPKGEFCLTFAKLDKQLFTPEDTIFIQQQVQRLPLMLEKVEFIR